jgi:hypothetical protein
MSVYLSTGVAKMRGMSKELDDADVEDALAGAEDADAAADGETKPADADRPAPDDGPTDADADRPTPAAAEPDESLSAPAADAMAEPTRDEEDASAVNEEEVTQHCVAMVLYTPLWHEMVRGEVAAHGHERGKWDAR